MISGRWQKLKNETYQYLEARAKPFGFYQFLDLNIPADCQNALRTEVFSRIRLESESRANTRVLQRIIYLIEYDLALLNYAHRNNLIKRWDLVQLVAIRYLYSAFDFFRFCCKLPFRFKRYLYTDQVVDKIGRNYSVTFALSIQNRRLTESIVEACLVNTMIADIPDQTQSLACETTLDFREKFEVIKEKARNKRVPIKDIVTCISTQKLYHKFFNLHGDQIDYFVNREEGSVTVKAIIAKSREFGIPSIVIYSGNVSDGYQFVTSDHVVTPSKNGKQMFCPNSSGIFHSLDAYPFIDFISIANSKPANIIGYVPMLGNSLEKYHLDNEVFLPLVESLPEQSFLIRPHPQEASQNQCLRYYESLASRYPNIQLDLSNSPSELLEQSWCVICTYISQLIEQIVMTNRVAIFLDSNLSEAESRLKTQVNSELLQFVDLRSLNSEYLNRIKENLSETQTAWKDTLEWFGYSERTRQYRTLEDIIRRSD